MANKKNQHYVPQFYFKFFSDNKRSINLLLKNNGKIIPNASIKAQCSKNNFYGSQEIEDIFSSLEGVYSQVLRDLSELNSNEELNRYLTQEKHSKLLEFILFQRLRTDKSANSSVELTQKFAKEVIDIHFKALGKKEFIDILPYIEVNVDKTQSLLRHLHIAFKSTVGLADLEPYILLNKTDIGFIFSDAPIIFYNKAFFHIKHSGALGFQSKGLIIFCPISPTRCIMLLDKNRYKGKISITNFIELTNDFDIKNINKLQLHNAESSMYFSNIEDEKYIKKLWKQEKRDLLVTQNINLNRYDEINNQNNKLIAVHEKQILFELNLSFLSSLRENMTFSNQPRSKKIALILNEQNQNK